MNIKQKIYARIQESVYNIKTMNQLNEYLKQFDHIMNVTYIENMYVQDLYMILPSDKRYYVTVKLFENIEDSNDTVTYIVASDATKYRTLKVNKSYIINKPFVESDEIEKMLSQYDIKKEIDVDVTCDIFNLTIKVNGTKDYEIECKTITHVDNVRKFLVGVEILAKREKELLAQYCQCEYHKSWFWEKFYICQDSVGCLECSTTQNFQHVINATRKVCYSKHPELENNFNN